MKPSSLKSFVVHGKTAAFPMQQLHYLSAFAYEYIDISVGRIKTCGSDLAAHPVDSYAHIARMLRHDYPVTLIQIEHSVFVCKIRKHKRHVKVGLVRMVTR